MTLTVLSWGDGYQRSTVTERHEFASAPWLEALTEVLGSLDLAGVTFTHCEELTNAPEHLCTPGQSSVAFYYRVTDGVVEVGQGLLDDCDERVVADYQTILPVVRVLYSDAAGLAEAQAISAKGAAEGKVRFDGDPSKRPPALAGVHDLIAVRTA